MLNCVVGTKLEATIHRIRSAKRCDHFHKVIELEISLMFWNVCQWIGRVSIWVRFRDTKSLIEFWWEIQKYVENGIRKQKILPFGIHLKCNLDWKFEDFSAKYLKSLCENNDNIEECQNWIWIRDWMPSIAMCTYVCIPFEYCLKHMTRTKEAITDYIRGLCMCWWICERDTHFSAFLHHSVCIRTNTCKDTSL